MKIKEILRQEFEKKRISKPLYNQKEFAKDLKIAPSTLSSILNGRRGLSRDFAFKLSQHLGFDERQTTYFCDLADAEYNRSDFKKETAKNRIKLSENNYNKMELDVFKYASEWYHWIIMERVNIKGASWEAQDIAHDLGLDIIKVNKAISRLIKLGLLTKLDNGEYECQNNNIDLSNMNHAVRKLHSSVLEQSKNAIQFGDVEERYVGNIFLGVKKSQIPEAIEAIKKFRIEFATKFAAEKNEGDEIYCISTQFFQPHGKWRSKKSFENSKP